MVKVMCDSCGKMKASNTRSDNEWLMGWDLETHTPNALSRSIRFLDHWDDRRALELGSIHFCSEACKDKYVRHSQAA